MLQAARRTAYATGCALAIAGWIFPVAMNAAVAQSAPSTATWPADFVLTKATLDCAGRELDVSMTSGPLEYTLWIGKHARMPDVDRFSVTVTPVGKPSGENAAMAFMDNAVLIVTSNGLQDPFDMHGKTAMAKPAARIRPGTSDYDRRYLPANLVMIAGGHLRRILCSPENPAARAKQQLGIDNGLVRAIAQSFVTLRRELPGSSAKTSSTNFSSASKVRSKRKICPLSVGLACGGAGRVCVAA